MNAADYEAEIAANDEEHDAEICRNRRLHRDTVRTFRSRLTRAMKSIESLATELLEEQARREEQRLLIVELKARLEAADDLRTTNWGLMTQLRLQLNNVKQDLEEADDENVRQNLMLEQASDKNVELSLMLLSEKEARDAFQLDLAIAHEDADLRVEEAKEQLELRLEDALGD